MSCLKCQQWHHTRTHHNATRVLSPCFIHFPKAAFAHELNDNCTAIENKRIREQLVDKVEGNLLDIFLKIVLYIY